MSLLAELFGDLLPELPALPATFPFHAWRVSPTAKLHGGAIGPSCNISRARVKAVTVDAATLTADRMCDACYGPTASGKAAVIAGTYPHVSLVRLLRTARIALGEPTNIAVEEHLANVTEFEAFQATARHADDPFTAALGELTERVTVARSQALSDPERLVAAFAPWCVDEVTDRLEPLLPLPCAADRDALAALLHRVAPPRWPDGVPHSQVALMRSLSVAACTGSFDRALSQALTHAVDLAMLNSSITSDVAVFDQAASTARHDAARRAAEDSLAPIAAAFREVYADRLASGPALSVAAAWHATLADFTYWEFPGVVWQCATRHGGAAPRTWALGPSGVTAEVMVSASLMPARDAPTVVRLDDVDATAALGMLGALADTPLPPEQVAAMVLALAGH